MNYRTLLYSFPNYRRVWLGQLVSEIGDWFSNVAIFATLVGLTHSGTAIAVFVIARHVPLLVFGPLAGVFADRFSRKRIMIVADLARAFLALGFLLVERRDQVWLIYLFAAGLMTLSSFFNAAKKASVPNLVDRPSLMVAIALSSSTTATTIAVGSAVGGIVSAGLGRDAAFIANALSFLFSMFMIQRAAIPATPVPQISPGADHYPVWRRMLLDFRAGLSQIRRVPLVAALVLVSAGWGFGNGVGRVVYSLYGAALGLEQGAGEDFGIAALYVAMGCGGICGTFVARRFSVAREDRVARAIALGLLWDGLCFSLFSQSSWLYFAGAVLFLREIGYTVWSTCHQTLLLRRVEDAMRGRVMATQETLAMLSMTASMLFGGLLIDRFGRAPVAFSGGCIIIAIAFFWGQTRHSPDFSVSN